MTHEGFPIDLWIFGRFVVVVDSVVGARNTITIAHVQSDSITS